MHHPIDRIVHTTAFVTPVVEHWVEREVSEIKWLLEFTVYINSNVSKIGSEHGTDIYY